MNYFVWKGNPREEGFSMKCFWTVFTVIVKQHEKYQETVYYELLSLSLFSFSLQRWDHDVALLCRPGVT